MDIKNIFFAWEIEMDGIHKWIVNSEWTAHFSSEWNYIYSLNSHPFKKKATQKDI